MERAIHYQLRGATSVASSKLRSLIPALFFELSDRDPRRLVYNVGYGYGSGFLVSLGIQLPPNSVDVPANEEGKDRYIYIHSRSEQIYILRLRATGVIDVENPVSAATHEGSSEEIE